METQVVEYNVNKAEIAKMSDIYMHLEINGIEDKEGADAVHSAKMILVKHRCAIDKLRKSTNATAQKFIKTNNANAKKLIDLMAPIEAYLKNEEETITAELDRIKKEKEAVEKKIINKRVMTLFAVGVNMPYFDVAMLDTPDYEKVLSEATEKHQAEQTRIADEEAARKAEDERLEKIAETQKAEAERLKIMRDTQEAALEKIRLEQEKAALALAEKEKALKLKEQAVENAKRKEQDRIDKIAFEEKAKVQAAKDTEAKVEREKKEEAERLVVEKAEKARLEALRPDQEKLAFYAESITAIEVPAVKSIAAHDILVFAERQLGVIAQDIIKKVEVM